MAIIHTTAGTFNVKESPSEVYGRIEEKQMYHYPKIIPLTNYVTDKQVFVAIGQIVFIE